MKEPSPGLFPSKQDLPQLFFILAIASVIAIACNYSVNFLHRPLKPFCSDGIPSSSISEIFHVGLHGLQPSADFCEPCPKNGRCYSNHWECIHGFKKRGKACVEDSEIYLRAKDLSDNIDQHVCKGHAQVLCGGIGQSWLTCLLRYIWSVRQHWYLMCGAEDLYEQVCKILEEKAMMTKNGSSDEPWVVASRLRDHLLLHKVEEFRQEDSRVDQYPKLVKGEQKVVWEWQVEGSLSSKVKPKREADAKKLSEKGHDSRVPRQKLQIRQLM